MIKKFSHASLRISDEPLTLQDNWHALDLVLRANSPIMTQNGIEGHQLSLFNIFPDGITPSISIHLSLKLGKMEHSTGIYS